MDLKVSWQGATYEVNVDPLDDVASLKRHLAFETGVEPKRQKIMGLKPPKGKPVPSDADVLGELGLKPGAKLMMMGTREADISAAEAHAAAAPEVEDDFETGEGAALLVEVADREENRAKLRRRVEMCKVELLNQPREGKRCLVLGEQEG
jgi:ubiquitin-like domain-containing CTD phosphatase 1